MRKMILLTWGFTNPRTAKTATGLLRFCPEECVAVFDPDLAGQTSASVLEVERDVPIVSALGDVAEADTLVIGIAPPGGKLPPQWRPVLLEAIQRGMNVLSGMHDFLSEDVEFSIAAEKHEVSLIDVRKNDFQEIAERPGFRKDCCRLHTVGHDCSVGKMLVSLELSRGLARRGHDTHFIGTGQTGIMVSGEGLPIDCIKSDFVSGAVEQLVVQNQEHDILVVEGQGSVVHPSYSAVTLGLLHGCQPHGLVFVFEAGRTAVGGMDHVQLPGLAKQRSLFETMARIYQGCETIAVAMNGRFLEPKAAKKVAEQVEDELNLPVIDVIRDGPDRLLDVAETFYHSGNWRTF